MTGERLATRELRILADPDTKNYFEKLSEKAWNQFELAQNAKKQGFDPSNEVETIPVSDVASRTEALVGPKGIAERYRQVIVENSGNRTKAEFQIFEEILSQKWCAIPNRERRLEQAIKTCLMIETEGVVVSPLDGLPMVKISKNFDGTEYVDIYYAGPIRAAGGRATVLPLLLADYGRKLMELDRYKPTEDEVERYVEELDIYQNEIVARQMQFTSDEIRVIINGCPVCVNGVPTEEREVVVHKDLERIPSNRIRGGMGLVVLEGLGLKATWVMDTGKKFGLDWSFLEKIIKVEKSAEKATKLKPSSKYLDRIAAGRPLLAYPSEYGGFRLRYGRCRNTGLMAKGINPSTMHLLDDFIAVGTHARVERPGKATQLFPCTSIDGPVVLLESGEVLRVNDYETAKKVRSQVKKILFLGDLLVTYGDFRKLAETLVPSPYVEEWWVQELKKAFDEGKSVSGINAHKVIENPREVNCFEAVELSLGLGIPLHPNFLAYYTALNLEELKGLVKAGQKAESVFEGERIVGARLENNSEVKAMLEKIGLAHRLEKISEKTNEAEIERTVIWIGKEFAYPFLKTIGALNAGNPVELVDDSVLGSLTEISGIRIRDKAGTFVGARMGRPEQAKPRQMKGNPHALFPIGLFGGSTRSMNKAILNSVNRNLPEGTIEAEIALFQCPKCGQVKPTQKCLECNERTTKISKCLRCGRINLNEANKCDHCNSNTIGYEKRPFSLAMIVGSGIKAMSAKMPEPLKGVKGLVSMDKVPEPIEKGILRAKYNLHVFRDGTMRYELLNAPLTHFKPKEINLSVEKARELGYAKDFMGRPLESEEQLLEMFPQDLVVHEGCGDWLVRVSQFVDELLAKYYGVQPYYNAKTREGLIGELVMGLAPHTSAGIVGRIIGYSKARLGWGHPYFHTVKRRNVDGDQDSVMLLLDAMLNFSEDYLSDKRGGKMDAPLVFTIALDPNEVDNEVYEMETGSAFPLEFYEKTMELAMPKSIGGIDIVEMKLGTEEQYRGLGFTHETECFDEGPKQSMYITLATMEEKIKTQARLQGKIRAVHTKDALERVLMSHFLPDIIGNAHSFSKQSFRCTNCNAKYRRIPLVGKCTKCGEGHLILTIAQGSVRKYLAIAKEIIAMYQLSSYLKQRVDLIEKEIDSVFLSEKPEEEKGMQKSLFEYV